MGEAKRKNAFKSTRLSQSKCTACGYILDAAMDSGHGRPPKNGDITICIKCSHIMAFGARLQLRDLNDEEYKFVAGNPEVLKIIKAIELTKNVSSPKSEPT